MFSARSSGSLAQESPPGVSRTPRRLTTWRAGLSNTRYKTGNYLALAAAGAGVYSTTTGIADILLVLAVICSIGNYRRPAVVWILVIAGTPLLSAAWSDFPEQTFALAGRVAFVVALANTRTWFISSKPATLLLLLMAAAATAAYGQGRHYPVPSTNAVTTSELGLVALLSGSWPAMFVSIPLLSSLATRGALAAAVIFALTSRSRFAILVVALAVGWWFIYAAANPVGIAAGTARLTDLDFVGASVVDRANSSVVTDGSASVETADSRKIADKAIQEGRIDAIERPQVHSTGYGIGAFNEKTGRQRPHNVPGVLIYELGIFAVPVLLGLAVALATKVPWPHAVALGAMYSLMIETPAGAAIGAYSILLLILFLKDKNRLWLRLPTAWDVVKRPALVFRG